MPSIAPTKEWRGMFPGMYSGNIWQTFNIDLERSLGRIGLSDKFRIKVDGGDVTNISSVPLKFIMTNADATERIWAIAGSKMINVTTLPTDPLNGTWQNDGLTGTPTDARDMEIHKDNAGEQRLVVTRATDMAILNVSGADNAWDVDWWTTTLAQAALQSSDYHPVARLQKLLSVGDKEKIHTIDLNDVVSNNRISTSLEYINRNAYVSKDRFWYGFENTIDSSKGKIVEWDGFSLTQNNDYEILGAIPMAGFIVNDIPYFLDEIGYIYKFNGAGFQIVAEFPCVDDAFSAGTIFTHTVSPHGIAVNKHLVYILTTGHSSSRRMRSGIWIFNTKNNNLYHYAGLGQHKTANTDIDYGQTSLENVGGLKFFFNAASGTRLVAGAHVHAGNITTAKRGVFALISNRNQNSSAGRNRGYFITTYIPIAEAEAFFEGVWIKFKRFVNSNNRIIIKYRVLDPLKDASDSDESLLKKNGTWVTTTTFTCIVPTGVAVGDEVEVIDGDNAGCSFKISALSATPDGSTTITVTIDEAAPTTSTGATTLIFDNFKKVEAISDTAIGNKKSIFGESAHGEFIQFKIELRGFGVEIDDLIPLFKVKTEFKQV